MQPYFENHSAGWLFLIVATVILHRAGRYVPGAAMGNRELVFVVGMVFLVAGAGLRWWSFWALRIHIKETALLSTAGDPYRRYAEHDKRLLPLIW